ANPAKPAKPAKPTKILRLNVRLTEFFKEGKVQKRPKKLDSVSIGTSGFNLTGGRTRQLLGHSSMPGRAPGPARESGNDHGDRAKRRRACTKVVGAASVRAGVRWP